MNRSLMKAAQIFNTLMEENNPVGVNEFARKLDMPKSTVSRFLSTMEALGFVRREPGSGKFRLGLKLFELGCRAIEDMDLREIAVPHMAKLRDAINENVLLTVLEGDRITYLEKMESTQAVVTQMNVGATAPAYCVSSGKAMLAYHPELVERVLASELKSHSSHTIVDPPKMREELEMIRVRGYALNKGEFREDVCGVGAPIFDARGLVVGAISTATPASRMNEERWEEHIESVLEVTRTISKLLGASVSQLSMAP